jgi:hypothetical protein
MIISYNEMSNILMKCCFSHPREFLNLQTLIVDIAVLFSLYLFYFTSLVLQIHISMEEITKS